LLAGKHLFPELCTDGAVIKAVLDSLTFTALIIILEHHIWMVFGSSSKTVGRIAGKTPDGCPNC
jgi:hypothetical protein